MLRVIFLSFFLLFVSVEAKVVTKSSTKEARGQGYGASYEEALSKALSDAVGRMYGGKLKQNANFKTDYTTSGKEQNLQKKYSDEISRVTGGSYDTYEVVKNIQSNGEYKVEVLIKKTSVSKSYQAPGLSANSRRSIVVFDSSPSPYRNSGVASSMQQNIINDLLQSRKFNVLDRDSAGYYEAEKAIIKSGDAASDEVYKLKNVLATDYILLFAIKGIEAEQKKSNLTGKTKTQAEVNVEYRVLLFATRQIKFANTLTMKVNIKDDSLSANEAAIAQIAGRISSDILNAIYPLKISEIQGEEVIFSQSVAVGESFECFSLGQVIKDSYTKENVGAVETRVGAVQILRSSPKLSYAKITEGNVKKGDVCRPFSSGGGTGPGYDIGRDANYEVNPNGGVNLGF